MSVVEETYDTLSQPGPRERYLWWKGLLDRCIAGILLVPGIPLICFLSVLVRATSRGKAIYPQRRVGKDGKVYTMYKLRSMFIDAEKRTGAVWATDKDPRITWFGRILRRTHLDELPQLFNVLKGEMALVGPRPERPEIVPALAKSIPGYKRRLAVLPGITGLAQINLPPDTDIDSVRRKQTLDLHYIETMGLFFDARLVLCTLLRTLGLRWQFGAKLFHVYCEVELGQENGVCTSTTSTGQSSLEDDDAGDQPDKSEWEDEGSGINIGVLN